MTKRSSLFDSRSSYGWISIVTHWLTAGIIIAMWLIGKSIASQPSIEGIESMRALHIILGLATWLLLAGRIIWRYSNTHPQAQGLTTRTYLIARFFHYLMLLCIGIMILSGPILALVLFDGGQISKLARTLHAGVASMLCLLVLIHILGVLKHLMFHDDDTLLGMLRPNQTKSRGNKESE